MIDYHINSIRRFSPPFKRGTFNVFVFANPFAMQITFSQSQSSQLLALRKIKLRIMIKFSEKPGPISQKNNYSRIGFANGKNKFCKPIIKHNMSVKLLKNSKKTKFSQNNSTPYTLEKLGLPLYSETWILSVLSVILHLHAFTIVLGFTGRLYLYRQFVGNTIAEKIFC